MKLSEKYNVVLRSIVREFAMTDNAPGRKRWRLIAHTMVSQVKSLIDEINWTPEQVAEREIRIQEGASINIISINRGRTTLRDDKIEIIMYVTVESGTFEVPVLCDFELYNGHAL